jgi:GAF domain-containing protein
MEGLHDLSRTAALMTEPSGTFARLSRRIAELVGAQKSWISLWEPDTRSLVFTPPGFGLPDEALRGVRVPLSDQSLPILAYRTGDTLTSQDLSSDPRLSRELKERLGVRSNAILVPLRTEVGVLGVLAVCDKEAGFDEEDRAAIRLYADQAAMILRNARLYEEVKQSFQRLREAHRSAGDFLADVDRELRRPLEEIGQATATLEASADEAVRAEGERIASSARRLIAFLEDLKSYSRRLTPPDVDAEA